MIFSSMDEKPEVVCPFLSNSGEKIQRVNEEDCIIFFSKVLSCHEMKRLTYG